MITVSKGICSNQKLSPEGKQMDEKINLAKAKAEVPPSIPHTTSSLNRAMRRGGEWCYLGGTGRLPPPNPLLPGQPFLQIHH